MGGAPRVALRPVREEDRPFLQRLYASTRAEELAALPWDERTAADFLQMQFEVQDRSYRMSYPRASLQIVTIDDRPGGRLYVDRDSDSIHVIDIALLPEHRGAGIGTDLMQELLEEGRRSGRRVTLNALRAGRALAWYQGLGFTIVGQDEVYADLEWRPQP